MAACALLFVGTVDVLLGNLEDAVKAENKDAARAAWSRSPAPRTSASTPACGHGSTPGLTVGARRPHDLVTEVGDRLDVVMVPKVQGPEDIHYVDRLLAQLEAKVRLTRPILVHAILETARGVANVEQIAVPAPGCRASASALPTSPPTAG